MVKLVIYTRPEQVFLGDPNGKLYVEQEREFPSIADAEQFMEQWVCEDFEGIALPDAEIEAVS